MKLIIITAKNKITITAYTDIGIRDNIPNEAILFPRSIVVSISCSKSIL